MEIIAFRERNTIETFISERFLQPYRGFALFFSAPSFSFFAFCFSSFPPSILLFFRSPFSLSLSPFFSVVPLLAFRLFRCASVFHALNHLKERKRGIDGCSKAHFAREPSLSRCERVSSERVHGMPCCLAAIREDFLIVEWLSSEPLKAVQLLCQFARRRCDTF